MGADELGLRINNRSLSLYGSFAYGVTDWFEMSISVPLRWDQNRLETRDAPLAHTNVAGLGDMGVQFIATLPVKTLEVTGVLGFMLPTGRDGIGQPGARSHFGLNVATIVRPAFLFGGLAWQHDWKAGRSGINYSGGVGFYLNHSLSAGVELSGTRFLNPPRGGVYDTASATVQVSYQLTPMFGLTPYMSFGLTESTPDVAVGFTVSRRF